MKNNLAQGLMLKLVNDLSSDKGKIVATIDTKGKQKNVAVA